MANEKKRRLHVFVDQSSIELFAGDGEKVFTLLTYAGEDQTGIELFALRSGTKGQLYRMGTKEYLEYTKINPFLFAHYKNYYELCIE